MRVKKLLLPVLINLVLFSFSQNNKNYNLLWKIEGKGLKNPSYIFGTMHVRDARAFNFSDSVMLALDQCSSFALEIHPDTMMMDVFNGILNDSTKTDSKLTDILSKADYEKLNEKFVSEYGYSIDKLKVKNPFVIRSMLSRSKGNKNDKITFVDAYLLGIAKTLNKRIYGLEKTKDQIDFFNSLSNENLKEQFNEIIHSDGDKITERPNNLIEIYSRGSIYEIENALTARHMMDSALIKRNHVMATHMDGIMRNNTLFTAVGVAHLPGNEGVLQLLKNKGYKVSPVSAKFTGVAKNYSVDASKIKWQTYTDSLNGFSIASPGAFMNLKVMAGLETKFYFDLTNILSYGYYAINMSGSDTKLDEKKLMENIINTYRNNEKYGLSKVKHINVNGMSAREVLVKTAEHNSIYLRLFIKNNILYGLFVGGETIKMNGTETEKYFNSFVFTERKIKKDPKWITFNQPEAAFSIALPSEPKLIEKEVESTKDVNYNLKMYMSTNLATMTNYLIRYNDYPSGMYIENKEKVFESMIEDIASKNKMVSGPDTTWKDGYEGRKFTCYLQGKFLTEGRIFVRGNRTYFILKQNLLENSDKIKEDDFFNSFTFEPYKKSSQFVLEPEEKDFQITLPSKPKTVKDTSNSFNSSIRNYIDYYSTNPNSGGLYHFEVCELSKYFRAKNISNYCLSFVKGLLEKSDSLVSSDSLSVNGFYGREYVISKLHEDNPRRIRIWFAGNKLFYMASFVGKDELFNEESNSFFNSFTAKPVIFVIDHSISKTDQILSGLLSKDTLTYKEALGAFDHYTFENEDLSKLSKALLSSYKDDSISKGARSEIINAIGKLKDTTALAVLAKQFHDPAAIDIIKGNALIAIVETDLSKGLPLYVKLLLSTKRPDKRTNNWRLFSPLWDSLEYTRDKFNMILTLADSTAYRSSILQLAYSIASSDSSGDFIKKHFTALTKYADNDLDTYFRNLADTSSFNNQSMIDNYLGLIQMPDKEEKLTDKFTARLLSNPGTDEYYKSQAIAVRVKYKLAVEPALVKQQLLSLDTRYDILKAYDEAGELDKVDSKFMKPKELGKLILYNYIIDDSDPLKEIKLVGNVEKGDSLFYVYSFSFEGDDNKYLGMAGPFYKKKKAQLTSLYAITSFELKAEDWKKQAQQLLKDRE